MKVSLCVTAGMLLALAIANGQEPKKADEKKPEPITKEWLLGSWHHPKDAKVSISFSKEEGGKLTAVSFDGVNFTLRTVRFSYVIDAKAGVVKMSQGDAKIGTGERTADGKLRVTAFENGLEKVVFERIKESEPKK